MSGSKAPLSRELSVEDMAEVEVRVMGDEGEQVFKVGIDKGASLSDLKQRMGVSPDASAVVRPSASKAAAPPSPQRKGPQAVFPGSPGSSSSPLHGDNPEHRRGTQEITDNASTIGSLFAPGFGSRITFVDSAQPAILSGGNKPSSSRRQRLSLSRTQEEVASGSPLAQHPSTRAGKAERFPLTGSLADLAKEYARSIRTAPTNSQLPGSNSDKAFVTFKTVTAATIACQVAHSVPGHTLPIQVHEAPDTSEDVFWANIHQGFVGKGSKKLVAGLVVGFLVVFFVFPVAYLSRIMGPNRMEDFTEELNWPWYELLQRKTFLNEQQECGLPACACMLVGTCGAWPAARCPWC
jgi:hypothetical protein